MLSPDHRPTHSNADPLRVGLGLLMHSPSLPASLQHHAPGPGFFMIFRFFRRTYGAPHDCVCHETDLGETLDSISNNPPFGQLIRDVEFVVTPNRDQEIDPLIGRYPHLAHIPWRSVLTDIPWRDFGYRETPELEHLFQIHGVLVSDFMSDLAQTADSTLVLLSRPSPIGGSYLRLLLQGRDRHA